VGRNFTVEAASPNLVRSRCSPPFFSFVRNETKLFSFSKSGKPFLHRLLVVFHNHRALMATVVIAKGSHGVNKLHVLLPARHCGNDDHPFPSGVAVLFPGDRIEAFGVDPEIMRLQEPADQAMVLAAKFPRDWAIAVVHPSRMEAGCSCYDHFFEKLTLTGEPLGYRAGTFKASQQLQSLLVAAGLYPTGSSNETRSGNGGSGVVPQCAIIGFSKGGIVLNQLLTELAGYVDVKSDESKAQSKAEFVPSAPLLTSLRELHYLDAGLNCRGAYLTDPRAFDALGRFFKSNDQGRRIIKIVLHGTPRQWGKFDLFRWIAALSPIIHDLFITLGIAVSRPCTA
jgi:hypothetical protein